MQKQPIRCSTFLPWNHDATGFCFQPHHSKPGAFIAQIAAIKTAFVSE